MHLEKGSRGGEHGRFKRFGVGQRIEQRSLAGAEFAHQREGEGTIFLRLASADLFDGLHKLLRAHSLSDFLEGLEGIFCNLHGCGFWSSPSLWGR